MNDPSRRGLLAALGSAAVVGASGCIRDGPLFGGNCPSYDPVVAANTDWTSRMGHSAGTARVAAAGAPEPGLSLDWMVRAGEIGAHVPVVADGTVYVHDGDTALLALDARSGDERWRTGVSGPLGAPALGDGTVVVRTRPGVAAYDAATGDDRWSALGEFETWFHARPVVADGTVYVMDDVAAYALDLATGEVRWRFPTGLPSDSTPAAADSTVYVAGNDTYVRALSTADGTEQWRAKTGGHVRSNVSVAAGRVCVGTDTGTVYAFDSANGTERWHHQFSEARNSDRPEQPRTINTDGARVYVTTDEKLYALDAADGSVCWRTVEYRSSSGSAVAVADGSVYVPTDPTTGGWFARYDATGGGVGERWEPDVEPFFRTGPSLADGALYTAGDGAVARFR